MNTKGKEVVEASPTRELAESFSTTLSLFKALILAFTSERETFFYNVAAVFASGLEDVYWLSHRRESPLLLRRCEGRARFASLNRNKGDFDCLLHLFFPSEMEGECDTTTATSSLTRIRV